MLNQAILLNINIGKKEMSTAIGLNIVIAVAFILFNETLLLTGPLFLIGMTASTIYEIKAINHVCYTSFFDDEGTLYMTLPVSAENMILGKALVISTFLLIESGLLYSGLILAVLFSVINYSTIFDNLSVLMPTLGESVLETVITFTLFPLSSFLECFFQSVILLTVFITLGLRKRKLFFCWVIAIVIFLPFGLGAHFVNSQMEELPYGPAISLSIVNIIYIAISYFALKKSVKKLEERYDV